MAMIEVPNLVREAVRVAPLRTRPVEAGLPFHEIAGSDATRLIIVGRSRNPPKTTQSLVEGAAARGMRPGEDIIVTRYRDLRVGAERGFVRMGDRTGADGLTVAGRGAHALFLFRGGGNLKPDDLRKIAMIEQVDGAHVLSDSAFIRAAGSKSITNDRLEAIGAPLARTVPVHGVEAAEAAATQVRLASPDGVAVLKKVNSLGGKDVHFIREPGQAAEVIRRDPDADFVVQEFLPSARDQDVRTHMVYNSDTRDFEVRNSYVRNRTIDAQTPNLANDGYATLYHLSPWEEQQAKAAAVELARGSSVPPLHVALDFFPRQPITSATAERHRQLQEAVTAGTMTRDAAIAASRDTVVVGEAASSAGTKGTEIVLDGRNPVTESMLDEIERRRAVIDAAR